MIRSQGVRRTLAATMLMGLAALAACGSGDEVTATGGDDGTTSTAGAPATTITAPPVADPGPSPVEGVDAAAYGAGIDAPLPPRASRASGPTADRVTLPDGQQVWRVRLPGDAPFRSARATIAVGGVDIGVATTTPALDALVALTTDGTPIVAGAAVTLRWENEEPAAVGRLEVLS